MKITNVIAIPAIVALGVQANDLASCRAACRGGPAAMGQFCGRLPNPILRAGCWGLTLGLRTEGGQTACANWCYWQYSRSRKRNVVNILEKRDDVSLKSDFKLTGIDLGADA